MNISVDATGRDFQNTTALIITIIKELRFKLECVSCLKFKLNLE